MPPFISPDDGSCVGFEMCLTKNWTACPLSGYDFPNHGIQEQRLNLTRLDTATIRTHPGSRLKGIPALHRPSVGRRNRRQRGLGTRSLRWPPPRTCAEASPCPRGNEKTPRGSRSPKRLEPPPWAPDTSRLGRLLEVAWTQTGHRAELVPKTRRSQNPRVSRRCHRTSQTRFAADDIPEHRTSPLSSHRSRQGSHSRRDLSETGDCNPAQKHRRPDR